MLSLDTLFCLAVSHEIMEPLLIFYEVRVVQPYDMASKSVCDLF